MAPITHGRRRAGRRILLLIILVASAGVVLGAWEESRLPAKDRLVSSIVSDLGPIPEDCPKIGQLLLRWYILAPDRAFALGDWRLSLAFSEPAGEALLFAQTTLPVMRAPDKPMRIYVIAEPRSLAARLRARLMRA